MRRPNIIVALACLALAAFVLFTANTALPGGNQGIPGPGVFPSLVAVLFALSALMLLISSLRNAATGEIHWMQADNKRAYLSFVAMVAYVFLLPVVGFITMTTILLTLLIKWYSDKNWVYSALVGSLAAVAVFAMFNFLFRVPLQFGFLI